MKESNASENLKKSVLHGEAEPQFHVNHPLSIPNIINIFQMSHPYCAYVDARYCIHLIEIDCDLRLRIMSNKHLQNPQKIIKLKEI